MSKKQETTDYIVQVLESADSGEFTTQVESELRSVIKGVLEHGGKGQIKIQLDFKSAGGSNKITVMPKISSTIPKPEIMRRLCFASDKGELLLDDPRQGQLELEETPRRVKVPAYTAE